MDICIHTHTTCIFPNMYSRAANKNSDTQFQGLLTMCFLEFVFDKRNKASASSSFFNLPEIVCLGFFFQPQQKDKFVKCLEQGCSLFWFASYF